MRGRLYQVAPADPDGLVESIRARSVVLDLWQDRLGELIGSRGRDAECQALLSTLQFGARPPRHLIGPPAGLLVRLRDALSKQIDLIVASAALDRAGVEFYRSLQLDLTAIDWGEPSDPIAALLERVCDRVHEFYERALGSPPGEAWPRVGWQVIPLRGHPTGPYTADGRTRVRDGGTVIEVRALAGHFGPEAFLSLPRILTHEFFAYGPARPRENHDIGLFTEGFLDWAALVLFETACGTLMRRAPGLALEHGRRWRAGPQAGADENPARSTGHLMARKVVHWWAGENGRLDRTGIRLRVAGLAARLNVYDEGLTLADKDEFVSALSPSDPAVAQALRDYLTDPAGPLEPLLAATGVGRFADSREPA